MKIYWIWKEINVRTKKKTAHASRMRVISIGIGTNSDRNVSSLKPESRPHLLSRSWENFTVAKLRTDFASKYSWLIELLVSKSWTKREGAYFTRMRKKRSTYPSRSPMMGKCVNAFSGPTLSGLCTYGVGAPTSPEEYSVRIVPFLLLLLF